MSDEVIPSICEGCNRFPICVGCNHYKNLKKYQRRNI